MSVIRFTPLIIAAILSVTAVKAAEPLVTIRVLSPELALKAAQGALKACRKQGYQVAVAVVDRMGVLQVVLRDRFAGPHTPDTARRKAWTAVSFRTNTLELSEAAQPGKPAYGIRQVEGALPVGGGVMIQAGGSMVGGIGVSGASTAKIDADCAKAGIAVIDTEINL